LINTYNAREVTQRVKHLRGLQHTILSLSYAHRHFVTQNHKMEKLLQEKAKGVDP